METLPPKKMINESTAIDSEYPPAAKFCLGPQVAVSETAQLLGRVEAGALIGSLRLADTTVRHSGDITRKK